jgi:hypothetical protein
MDNDGGPGAEKLYKDGIDLVEVIFERCIG